MGLLPLRWRRGKKMKYIIFVGLLMIYLTLFIQQLTIRDQQKQIVRLQAHYVTQAHLIDGLAKLVNRNIVPE